MKKLQQFYIMKFSSSRLEKFNYHLKRVRGGSGTSVNDVRRNHELIALGDNQALRTIRQIRYERNPNVMRYDPELLKEFYAQKRHLKKQQFTDSVKRQISIINNKIDDMLFMPEYVSVVIEDITHYYKMLQDGLYINGYKYVRLMCSASQARVNTVIFIREDYEKEVKRRLKCGAKDVKITKNKYNAYFALSSSSTYLIPKPNVFLVDDCEIKMTKKVDWISKIDPDEKTPLSNNERVTEETKELEFNLFDGCGAVSVEFAKKMADELCLDYLPSAFCVRCAYVKGMIFVVDFKQYARENNITVLNDLYGNPQNIEEIDMILTKSQFKLYNAYDSIEDYYRLCDENGMLWGVTKVTPKTENSYFRSNYQFCQAIDLTNEKDVEELCQPTVDWLTGVAGGDINQVLLYLLGSICDKKDVDFNNILNLTNDNVAKSLILNNDMINDEYIRSTIMLSINKKIRESYLGKLILNGNFSVMIPDMYAFMQHSFGRELTGALKENEYYSHFWNERGKNTVVAMRSPLTWRSEVNKLPLTNNELTEKWFKYLTSGIVYNVWGCDCIIHADSDFDGDIVATTDNEVFLRCRYDNLPITYTKSTVDKEMINEDELYQADVQSFNSSIGQITNISTSFYELLSKFEGKPECQKYTDEIIERLKLIRKSQGDAIDKAKGIKIEPMPKHWTRVVSKLPEGETQERMDFCNQIVADRKPYFFRYLYPNENAKYLDYVRHNDLNVQDMFKKTLRELLNADSDTLSQDELEYIEEQYKKDMPLIDYNGRMNKICHYMEQQLKEIHLWNIHTPKDVLEKMYSVFGRDFEKSHIDIMNKFYFEYKKVRQELKANEFFNLDYGANIAVTNISNYCSFARKAIFDRICYDAEYITDLALYVCYEMFPSRSKSFVWDLFGDHIVKNLKNHKQEHIMIPVFDENGTIKYLENRYRLQEIYID